MPHCSRPYGKVGEIEGRLAVAGPGSDGKLHVLTKNQDRWDTFTRDSGIITSVVCHQDVCLVLVNDKRKHQLVVEQFCLTGSNKCIWCPLTVLPNELQLLHNVSFALHDNSLYAVGGKNSKTGEKVSTVRVYDLQSSHWSELDDMHKKRSDCSTVVTDNTIIVAGGFTDGDHSSNAVECVDVRMSKRISMTSTTNHRCTLTAVNNKPVVTGGEKDRSPSNVVEIYEKRCSKWRPLPPMKSKRRGHGALTMNEDLIAVGGLDKHEGNLTTIESIHCD